MQMTFALRRQEIVQENPLVRDFLEKWPALRMESQEVQDVHMKRNAALRALPLYLREEDPEFFKSWSAEEVDRPDITNTPVAIVSMVTEGTPSETPLRTVSILFLNLHESPGRALLPQEEHVKQEVLWAWRRCHDPQRELRDRAPSPVIPPRD
ncbi:hypothetical protein KUCAC02_030151 [Chaenocephalus aceratus]|uniref:Uncharacterized protein n=1 Tax=Chaenocephalus aceratus TaxID=36190 RepID=A0ACB9XI19_CHAAC|nr:hypothetical protein KUCAC02_030151 [Chaenocephalus aceratus]